MATAKIDGFPLYEDSAPVRAGRSGDATCALCGKQEDSRAMIEAYRSDRIDPDQVCVSCWGKRGEKPAAAPSYIPPVAPHPLACLAASAHKTHSDAMARADKVAYHLGRRPEITPREPGADTYFVVGDSPLVPGFKPAENPCA